MICKTILLSYISLIFISYRSWTRTDLDWISLMLTTWSREMTIHSGFVPRMRLDSVNLQYSGQLLPRLHMV